MCNIFFAEYIITTRDLFEISHQTLYLRWGSEPRLFCSYVRHKNGAYFPLLQKFSIIVCSERLFGENHIALEPIYQFALQINYWFPYETSPHWKLFRNMLQYGSNKDTPKTLQFAETLDVLTISRAKFSIEYEKDPDKSRQTKALWSVRKHSLALKITPYINRSTASESKSMDWFTYYANLN